MTFVFTFADRMVCEAAKTARFAAFFVSAGGGGGGGGGGGIKGALVHETGVRRRMLSVHASTCNRIRTTV